MRKYLIALSTFTLASHIALADEYRAEVSANYIDTDSEEYALDNTKGWGLGGTYYFSPVNTNNHPLAEAAFLERASNLELSYIRSKADYRFDDGAVGISSEVTSESKNANINFYIPNTMFFIGAGISDTKLKTKARYFDGEEYVNDSNTYSPDSQWNATLGITPIDGLLISTAFYEDVDVSDFWNLSAKYVTQLGDNAINIEAGYANFYQKDSASLTADYYFDNTFSIGAGYAYSDSNDGNTYLIRTKKFLTNNISLDANYSDSDDDSTLVVGASVRF